MNIYLARHGQNEDNANGILNGHRDLPLTKMGREQAAEAAAKIQAAGLHLDYIFTSPLIRAKETAEIIQQTIHGPVPKVLLELIERNFGVMTGVQQSKIVELCAPNILKTETVNYFLSPEGAETFPDLLLRAKQLLLKLKNENLQGNILLVGHGDFGKMIYAAYYDLEWQDVLRNFHFGNSELLLLSPDSSASDTHIFKIAQHNS